MELYRELVNKLMYVIALLTILIIVVFFGVINHDKIWSNQLEDPILDWNPYDIVLNNPEVPEDVKEGFLLLDSSAIYMGPLNKDPKLRFSGNNLSCTNCHLNGGTKSKYYIKIPSKKFRRFCTKNRRDKISSEEISSCA